VRRPVSEGPAGRGPFDPAAGAGYAAAVDCWGTSSFGPTCRPRRRRPSSTAGRRIDTGVLRLPLRRSASKCSVPRSRHDVHIWAVETTMRRYTTALPLEAVPTPQRPVAGHGLGTAYLAKPCLFA